jgi:hypothetical protein
VVPAPITGKQLTAILKSLEGKDCLTLRLAIALRDARLEAAELARRLAEQETAWQSRERVLVVSETDGAVEIFGESWVTVKCVEVKPWEDRDDLVWSLGAEWRKLDEAPKSKALIVPQIRSELDDRALVDLLRWEKRSQVLGELLGLIRSRA